MTLFNINMVFVGTPDTYMGVTPNYARLSDANTNRDGTGTLEVLVDNSVGTAPVRVDKIAMQAIGVTTAGWLRFFLSNGSAIRLIKEIPVAAEADPDTNGAWSDEWVREDDLALVIVPIGGSLMASTNNDGSSPPDDNFDVTVQGGAY